MTKMRYIKEKRLISMPQRPSEKGPGVGGWPRIFLSIIKRIGRKYEMCNPMATSDVMALNAVEEPR